MDSRGSALASIAVPAARTEAVNSETHPMRIKSTVLSAACALALVAPSVASAKCAEARSADVGTLHNLVLRDLLDSDVMQPGVPVTREAIERAMRSAAEFTRLRLDEQRLADDNHLPRPFVHAVTELVLESAPRRILALLDAAGAYAPSQDGDPRHDVMTPSVGVWLAATRALCAESNLSFLLPDTFERLARQADDAPSAGAIAADARRAIKDIEWTPVEQRAADAGVDILEHSLVFWSGGDDGVDLTTMSQISDTAHADTVGGVIGAAVGGLIGAIGGGGAGLLLGGPAGAIVGVVGGAAVGAPVTGAVAGAVASIAQYVGGAHDGGGGGNSAPPVAPAPGG